MSALYALVSFAESVIGDLIAIVTWAVYFLAAAGGALVLLFLASVAARVFYGRRISAWAAPRFITRGKGGAS